MRIDNLNKTSLKKGTLIETTDGYIVLKSNWNPHRNEYKYTETTIDEDGNITESGELKYISADDLRCDQIC